MRNDQDILKKTAAVSFNHFAICGVLLFVVLFFPNRLLANGFYGWHHGASGYSYAIQEAEYEEKPLVVYFHVEWCKWCKKMNNDYLASYEVEDFLRNIPKVEINPEKGADEEALASKYGVTGYPSLLVSVPSLGNKNERIYPFREGADWTNDEFIDAIRSNIANTYNKKGHSCYQGKQYEEAISIWKRVLYINTDYLPAHAFLSACYSSLGRKNEAALAADEVLRIDPSFNIESYEKTLPYKNREDKDRYLNALQMAGLSKKKF